MATNVLMSALIARGVCTDLFEYVIRQHELVTSEYILNELFQHLINKFKFELAEAQEVLELLRSRTKVVLPIALGTPGCRNPTMIPFWGQPSPGKSLALLQVIRICWCLNGSSPLILSLHQNSRTTRQRRNPSDPIVSRRKLENSASDLRFYWSESSRHPPTPLKPAPS